jgi:hypothetical protein
MEQVHRIEIPRISWKISLENESIIFESFMHVGKMSARVEESK